MELLSSQKYTCKKTDEGNIPYFGETSSFSSIAIDGENNVTYILLPNVQPGSLHDVEWRIEKRRKARADKCGRIKLNESQSFKHVPGVIVGGQDVIDIVPRTWFSSCKLTI
ncbi:MAG: hypothetical protein NT070_18570 [Cyanobacteria bacterium]|nr:hypothetical protein [Cyanobacteriota bacterium]